MTAPTAREIAIRRVRDQVATATEEASNAGYVIALNIGALVDGVVDAFQLDELKLPRYYPADENSDAYAYLVGTARHVDPETGAAPNLYAWWRTDLPGDRLQLNFGYGVSVAAAREVDPVASCVAPADVIDNLCRILLAGAAHSRANPTPPAGLLDISEQADTPPPAQEQSSDVR